MHRRNFMKMASTLGTVIPAWALTPAAFSKTFAPYTGKILINVYAGGGLDQSSWVDPRDADKSINSYAGTDAGIAGNIRYAPIANNKSFFDKYHQQCLVINGIHSETNAHEDGRRVHHTGTLASGFPNISEVFASHYGTALPMPWLNGIDLNQREGLSSGLLAPTTLPSADTLRSMAEPNSASTTRHWMKQADIEQLQQTREARMLALNNAEGLLPRTQNVLKQSLSASQSRPALEELEKFVPKTFDRFSSAQIALIIAQAGFTTAVQIGTGGFDTHTYHDAMMAKSLPKLTDLVDYIWQKSAELGISDRIFLRIYSEIGRTPYYSNNGKDHWSVGSQVWMEANPPWGNRVFGASGRKHESLKIAPNGTVDPSKGVVIKPRHVHVALRKYLNFTTTDPRFDLDVPSNQSFDFFNPTASTGYGHLL